MKMQSLMTRISELSISRQYFALRGNRAVMSYGTRLGPGVDFKSDIPDAFHRVNRFWIAVWIAASVFFL